MTNNTVEQQLVERDRILLALKEQLGIAQEQMKKCENKKCREVEIEALLIEILG